MSSLRESKASTPLQPPGNSGVVKQIKNNAFFLEDHKKRMARVGADFESYRRILSDLSRRVEVLEDLLKEVSAAKGCARAFG